MQQHQPIRRALISASDKTGLIELSKALQAFNIEILATGGTAKLLTDNNIDVVDVADYTEFPEMMDGRVKTLHPRIHGGLLGRRTNEDNQAMDEHGIRPIDLLIVNLYPFSETIAKANCTFEDAIENIDVGGPSMLRAAAKNFNSVTVLTDPSDYTVILDEMQQHGGATTWESRKRLAGKVFAKLHRYDAAIAGYLNGETSSFADQFDDSLNKVMDLRYGENPHQAAALYQYSPTIPGSLANAKLLQGKPLSFNNLMDADAALNCVRALDVNANACVILKHATPCGVAESDSQLDAYNKAYACDSSSAFGGIIAFNQTLTSASVEKIISQQFVEVILAPEIEADALTLLSQKKNLRVLQCGSAPSVIKPTLHSISGGVVMQESDHHVISADDLSCVTKIKPTDAQIKDLLFAWRNVQFVKSNAILYAKDLMTLGIGTGQTSRVFAAEIAALRAKQAGFTLDQAVMASDAFFPFADSIEFAAANGISAIIQPGGSKRDNEVIAMADKKGIAMVFTGIRHFKH